MSEYSTDGMENEHSAFQHNEWDWNDAECPVCESEYTIHRVCENRVRRIVSEGDVVEDRVSTDAEEVIITITCRKCGELLYDINNN